jgi:hypothetical protein
MLTIYIVSWCCSVWMWFACAFRIICQYVCMGMTCVIFLGILKLQALFAIGTPSFSGQRQSNRLFVSTWMFLCRLPFEQNVQDVTKSSNEGRIIGHIRSQVRSVTKSSNEVCNIGPHLVEVHDETKSFDEGHILDHIWSKSTVRQPPIRGAFFDHIWSKSETRQSPPTRGTQIFCHPRIGWLSFAQWII